MMQNLNELIENYCEITGRPAASLSVMEYLQFATSTAVMGPNIQQTRPVEPVVREMQPIKVASQKEEHVTPVSERPVEKKVVETKPMPKPQQQNNVLDMLRSVSG